MGAVSDVTRGGVWALLCDLERNVRYYGMLAGRYRTRYRVIRYFLLLGVLVEGFLFSALSGAFLEPLMALAIGGSLAVMLGVLTVFDSVTNYAEAAAELRLASVRCDELGADAARLWRDVKAGRVSGVEAEGRLCEVINQWSNSTRGVSVELHDHDNRQAAIAAEQVIANRYGR